MSSTNPVPAAETEVPAETLKALPFADKLMLCLLGGLFLLFSAMLLGELIAGMFR
jgi:hypothetical protein